MQLEGVEKLVAAIFTGLAALMAPVGVIYAARVNRDNKMVEASVASLTVENERLKDELEEAQDEARAERRSGLRWYQLSLWWFHAAHNMKRHTLDARQVAESGARIQRLPQPTWSEGLHLPDGVEDPIPLPPTK